MIEGFFYPELDESQPYISRPLIEIDVKLEKHPNQLAKLHMLVDTGADRTSLSVRDTYCLLGVKWFWRIQRQAPKSSVITLGNEPALFTDLTMVLALKHNSSKIDTLTKAVQIPMLSTLDATEHTDTELDNWMNEQLRTNEGFRNQPSVLGRDILCDYILKVDYGLGYPTLEHRYISYGGLI